MNFKLTINSQSYKPVLPSIINSKNLIFETDCLINEWKGSDGSKFYLIKLLARKDSTIEKN